MAISVLVVDDDRSKVGHIVGALVAAGVGRELIDVGQTGIDARRHLTTRKYDLLILDIALPMRAEDAPDRQGGIKLLREILDRDIYMIPTHVIGVTGFEDLQSECAAELRSRLWSLELYDPCDRAWQERLRAKAEFIIARCKQIEPIRYQSDLAVLSALHTPELSAIRSIQWEWTGPQSLDEVGYFYEGAILAGGEARRVVAAAAPRMGMVATAILASKIIGRFRPRLLAMAGICAGLKDQCAIGDVLVADPAWDWQMGKYAKGQFYLAPDQIDIPTAIAERFRMLASDQQLWFDIYNSYTGNKPQNLPSLKIGPVTSGSAVLADTRILSEIKRQHRNLLGVEMELYGMYVAARDCSPPNPVAFGVKSVCDFADDKKNDDYQAYASHVSARCLAAFCERYLADFARAT